MAPKTSTKTSSNKTAAPKIPKCEEIVNRLFTAELHFFDIKMEEARVEFLQQQLPKVLATVANCEAVPDASTFVPQMLAKMVAARAAPDGQATKSVALRESALKKAVELMAPRKPRAVAGESKTKSLQAAARAARTPEEQRKLDERTAKGKETRKRKAEEAEAAFREKVQREAKRIAMHSNHQLAGTGCNRLGGTHHPRLITNRGAFGANPGRDQCKRLGMPSP